MNRLDATQKVLDISNLDFMKDDVNNLMDKVLKDIGKELNAQLENAIIEGLKRKGFEFENRIYLEDFVRSNCRCEDNIDRKERVYFANDTPFFIHYYESVTEFNPFTSSDKTKIEANWGKFAYL